MFFLSDTVNSNGCKIPYFHQNAFIYYVGGFASGYYWSSTENNNNNAWKQNFNNGNQNNNNKNNTNYVRAVRGFKQNTLLPGSITMRALIIHNLYTAKFICN